MLCLPVSSGDIFNQEGKRPKKKTFMLPFPFAKIISGIGQQEVPSIV